MLFKTVKYVLLSFFLSANANGSKYEKTDRTVFEHLIYSLNKTGAVTYPIATLVEEINGKLYNDSDRRMLGLITTDFNHYKTKDPWQKQIVSIYTPVFDNHLYVGPHSVKIQNRLYLLYQEKENILDIISYDDKEGNFNFQRVINYGPNGQNHISDVKREACIRCHSSGGPEFNSKYHESSKSQISKLQSLIIDKKISNDDDNNRKIEKVGKELFYNGVLIAGNSSDIHLLRESVSSATEIIQYNTLWNKLCNQKIHKGYSLACRGDLLYFSLLLKYSGVNFSSFFADSSFVTYKENIKNKFLEKKLSIIHIDDEINSLVLYLSKLFSVKDLERVDRELSKLKHKRSWSKLVCNVRKSKKRWLENSIVNCGVNSFLLNFSKDYKFIDGSVSSFKSLSFNINSSEKNSLKYIIDNNNSLTLKLRKAFRSTKGSLLDLLVFKRNAETEIIKLHFSVKHEESSMESALEEVIKMNKLKKSTSLYSSFPDKQSFLDDLILFIKKSE